MFEMVSDNTSDYNGINDSTREFIGASIRSLMSELGSWPDGMGIPAKNYIKQIIKSDSVLLSLKVKEDETEAIIVNGRFDIHKLWQYLPDEHRTNLGQFFTPIKVVKHILDVCHENDSNFLYGEGPVADISCGSGIFLEEFIRRQLKQPSDKKINPALALSRTIGVDKDPQACALAKLSVAYGVCDTLRQQGIYEYFDDSSKWPIPQIYCANSLDYKTATESFPTEHIFDNYEEGFDAIIGNFPFLESKRMNKYDPNLKSWIKAGFPQLFGAFDSYVPFVYQSIKLLKNGGIFGVVLPNKVLVGKYAKYLRHEILKENQLIQISDFSRVKNSFTQTGVYPISLFFKKGKTGKTKKIVAVSVKTLDALSKTKPHLIDSNLFELIGPNYTFHCQNPQYFKHIDRLYKSEDSIRLKDILDIKTTISFHKKGVRENFIKPTKELLTSRSSDDVYPYLGGISYAKKNEIDSYSLDWRGYSIYYPKDMKEKVSHNVAPKEIFLQPKIIFCQHSQRLRAYFDHQGTFLTKDVYPIAFPREEYNPITLGWLMTAYFNSTFVSAIYNTIYHGIIIGSRYYHYLPSLLNEIAVVLPDKKEEKKITETAEKIQILCGENENLDNVRMLYDKLDLGISLINGLTEKEHGRMVQNFKLDKIFQHWDNV